MTFHEVGIPPPGENLEGLKRRGLTIPTKWFSHACDAQTARDGLSGGETGCKDWKRIREEGMIPPKSEVRRTRSTTDGRGSIATTGSARGDWVI